MSARIGLIVPSSNTVMEVDLYSRLPERVALHTARMYLEETTPEGESAMLDDHLPTAISDLATARPDVMVFGCTSAGALRGNAYEAELISRISDATGAPTVSVAAAVRQAIIAQGARRIGVITPYVDALNDRIAQSLRDDGLEVVAIHGLRITDNFTIAEVTPEQIVGFALDRFGVRGGDGAAIDLLFASCTNFRAFDARDRLADALDLPVLTSNQAALHAALDLLGATATA
jgi:maleate isomerase